MKQIKVSFGFGAFACVLFWLNWRISLWFLFGIVCHELGHLFVMKLCRVPILGVSVNLTGAVIQGELGGYKQEMVCALAGPIASFLAAAISGRQFPGFAIVSGLLGAVNLLPLFPLDGGRILRAVLFLLLKEETAVWIVKIVTWSVCGLLMLGACWLTVVRQAGLWPIFVALTLLCRIGQASLVE